MLGENCVIECGGVTPTNAGGSNNVAVRRTKIRVVAVARSIRSGFLLVQSMLGSPGCQLYPMVSHVSLSCLWLGGGRSKRRHVRIFSASHVALQSFYAAFSILYPLVFYFATSIKFWNRKPGFENLVAARCDFDLSRNFAASISIFGF